MNRLNYLLSGGVQNPSKAALRMTGIIILFLLVTLIITILPYIEKSDNKVKEGIYGSWIGLTVIYFVSCSFLLYFTNIIKGKTGFKITSIVFGIFAFIQLILGCVLLAIENPDIDGREKGILFGKLIMLYVVLIIIHIRDYLAHSGGGEDGTERK